jgi:hypothetical protein
VEESGQRTSHFELYIRAVEQAGGNTQAIRLLVASLEKGHTVREALADAAVPAETAAFVDHTFRVIEERIRNSYSDTFMNTFPVSKTT